MKRIIKIVIMGVVLLGLVFFILVKNTSGTTNVVRLVTDVSIGQVITPEMLEEVAITNGTLKKDRKYVIKKDQIVGKSLSVSRVDGDYIPENIIQDVKIELADGEAVFSIKVPKDDIKLINQGSEIGLSLISNSNQEPMYIKGIYVVSIHQALEENNNGNEENLVLVKTSELMANKISPFIKDQNYKLIALPQIETDAAETTDTKQEEKTDTNQNVVEDKK